MEKQQKQHLAIFTPPFLDLILEGRKTVEGRFSKVCCAPFGVVQEGDVVLMKESGGLVKGSFVVAKVESFENLTEEKLKELEAHYSDFLCADADPQYWQRRRASKYATLMHVAHPTRFKQPFPFPKKDRRGWVVIEQSKEHQLSFFPEDESGKDAMEYDPSGSRCAEGLHTFFRTTLFNQDGYPCCRWCGADLVDWRLLHRRSQSALDSVIVELRKEYWRDSWFRRPIDVRAKNHALRKGENLLREYAKGRIRSSVGPAQPYRDGFQTPYAGNIVFYAQHAVAACCRNCIEVWHGIPKGKNLADQDIAYLTELVMKYVDVVMPELDEDGIHVPPIKKPKHRKE
jgi:predicted transcriptional regulator